MHSQAVATGRGLYRSTLTRQRFSLAACYPGCYNAGMPRRNKMPFVQVLYRGKGDDRTVRGYRGYAQVGGRRRFAKLRATEQEAFEDAMQLRGRADVAAWGGTLGTRATKWLAEVGQRLTPDTITFYEGKLATVYRSIPKTCPLEKVTAAALGVFIREAKVRGLSGRTILHCRRTLHVFFAWCCRKGFARENPTDLVEWPRAEDTPPDVMNEVELVGALGRITDPWAADLAVAIAYTGLRRAEVARLQVADVQLAERVLWVRGKARSQSHPIPADAVAALQRLLATAGEREHVVPGITDEARRERVAETFRTWQRKLAEPRWHPHALRHSVATIMLRKGVSPATVQRFLRHSSYAMTQRYVHLVEADLHEATTRLRLVGGDGEAKAHG